MTQLERTLASAVSAALEALEAGDQRHAVEILLSAQEEGRRLVQLVCPECDLDCRFPGQLEEHRARVHGVAAA